MAVKNLVSGVLEQSITTSTTNVLVKIAENVDSSGIQSFFPTPPFYITIMPKAPAVGVANRLDSEILQVTAVGNGQSGNASLTCVRGQRDTTAKAFDVGSIVTVGVYADDAVFLGGEGSAVGNPAPWIETSDIKNGAITTNKIADGAVKSAKIDWTTLYKSATPLSAMLPAQANKETTVQSFSLPAGKWRVFWSVRGYGGENAQPSIIFGGLKANGDKVQTIAINDSGPDGIWRPYISCSYEANIASSTTFSTYITVSMESSISVDTTYLFALRVG